MSKALFITRKQLSEKTSLNGNIDPDKLLQYIEIAQDINIQTLLGTQLYNRLQAGVLANDLTSDETSLLDNYVANVLIHYANVEFLHYAGFEIANGGVFRHNSENSSVATTDEIDRLIEKERSTAKFYENRMIDYLCANNTLYPLYTQYESGDLKADRNKNYTNWAL